MPVKRIIKILESFDGSKNGYAIFCDWVKLTALSISNQVWYEEKRESEYLQLAKTYKPEELQRFCEMAGILWEAFDNTLDDYLGKIYMQGNMGNSKTGQFFTPFHLAELTARMSIDDLSSHLQEYDQIELNEPASGGGGMILAVAKGLKDKGMNYQRLMNVTAQDLDWTGVYMTYIQLSMAGIAARVIQGDTLTEKQPHPNQIMYTPMYVMNARP